ncbi:MAG: hypothetical protein WBY94_23785 [Polyangiaceae bacterium]
MVVAMRFVRMVQVTVDHIVDVFAVRNGVVTAARAVTMRARVCSAIVPLRASVRVLLAHGNDVLFEVVTFAVMEVAIV